MTQCMVGCDCAIALSVHQLARQETRQGTCKAAHRCVVAHLAEDGLLAHVGAAGGAGVGVVGRDVQQSRLIKGGGVAEHLHGRNHIVHCIGSESVPSCCVYFLLWQTGDTMMMPAPACHGVILAQSADSRLSPRGRQACCPYAMDGFAMSVLIIRVDIVQWLLPS